MENPFSRAMPVRSPSQRVEARRQARTLRNDRALGAEVGLDELGGHVARGSMVALASYGVFVAIQVAQLVILSRLLTPDDFGVVGMALAVTGFIRLFQDMGLTSATIQRRDIDQDLVSSLFFINLAVGVALMLACWAAAPFAGMVFDDQRVVAVIVLLALTMPMLALRAQHRALVSRRMEFVKLNLALVVSNLAGLLVACLLAWFTDWGYWAVVAGQLAAGFVDMVFFWVASAWRPQWPRAYDGLRSAFSFGVNIMGANILGWVWKQSDNALIGWRWGTVELGYYARAYSILLMPLAIISGPVASSVIPALSRLQDERDKWARLFTRTARILSAFSALMALLLILNAKFLVDLVLGPGWDASARIFSILALSVVPSVAWELSRFVFLSLGRSDVMLKYSLIAGPLHLAAFCLGLASGGVGVAWGLTVVSWGLAVPILVVSARTAGIGAGRLLGDLAPVLAAFAAAYALGISLVAGLTSGRPLLDALALSALAIAAFVAVLALAGSLRESWRADMALAARRIARWVARSDRDTAVGL